MPFVRVTVTSAAALTPAQTRALQERTTDLMARVLRKRAEVTAVLVESVPAAAWSVGAEPPGTAAHLEATVTAGTNDAAEKERFVAEAMAMLRDVLGPGLHPVAYVVVREVPAGAWGYDGLTQERRQAQAIAR